MCQPDALNENHREALEADIKENEKSQNQLRSQINDLDSSKPINAALTEAETILGNEEPVIVELETLAREEELIAAGLPVNNTSVYTASEALGTVRKNRATIERLAEEYNVPPELLAGVIASEMDFDHDSRDKIQDAVARRFGISGGKSGGVGPASVHRTALDHAIEEQEAHVPGFTYNEDVLDVKYRASFEGSAESAAIVLSQLVREFNKDDDLSPQDMALIWSGYRNGVQDVSDLEDTTAGFLSVEDWQNGKANGTEEFDEQFQQGANAYMSEPIFEYLAEQYA